MFMVFDVPACEIFLFKEVTDLFHAQTCDLGEDEGVGCVIKHLTSAVGL